MVNVTAMASNEPLVSISCVTYNHEAFIADAIEGFLQQQTTFPVEILIHDDASTDGTAQIVRAYERAHPDRIRAICQRENQCSKGTRMSHFNYVRARGKYIALCEGDDYWTDPLKLAKQIQAMEANPEVGLCFHAAQRITHGAATADRVIGRYAKNDAVIPTVDIIRRAHGSIPTASCVITKKVAEELMRFRTEVCGVMIGDVVVEILSSFSGGAIYLNEVMSVYRYRVPGSWSSRQAGNCEYKMKYARDRIQAISALDAYSKGNYAHAFSEQNRRQILRIARTTACTREQKFAFYREFGSLLNLPYRMKYLAKAFLTTPQR